MNTLAKILFGCFLTTIVGLFFLSERPTVLVDKILYRMDIFTEKTMDGFKQDKAVVNQEWKVFILDVCCDFPIDFRVEEVHSVDLDHFPENGNHEIDHWDPFLLKTNNDGTFTILYETAYFDESKQWNITINEATINNNGSVLHSEVKYDPKHKISYPIPVKMADGTQLIGLEEFESKTGFPGFYRYDEGLCRESSCLEQGGTYPVNVAMFDPTVLYKDGVYFLFGTDGDGYLRLFYGEDLLSNNSFTEHPDSPITNDPIVNRSAGKIFQIKGKLYRPTMYNTEAYGRGVNLQEIIQLDTKVFTEKNVANKIFKGTKFEDFNDGLYHHIDILSERNETGEVRLLVDGAKEVYWQLHGKRLPIKMKQE